MKKLILILILFTSVLVADSISIIGSKFSNTDTIGVNYERNIKDDITFNVSYLRTNNYIYKRCNCKTFDKDLNRVEINFDKPIFNHIYIGSGIGYTSKKVFRQGLYIPLSLKLKIDTFKFHTEVSYNYLADIRDIRDTKDEIRLLIGVNF